MDSTATQRTPWYVWTSFLSVACILIGSYWDISWHMTIGRDSFWTPAHLAIQLGGIISGTSGAYLIFSTTFRRRAPLRDASISVWGFRGPFGAFLGVWGAATMLVSVPFDNWWHEAYGLDVKILSPPHMVLTLGILGVASGAVLQVVGALNRATAAARRRLEAVMVVIGGLILVLGMTAILELTFRVRLHSSSAYQAIAVVAPVVLLANARASGRRWAATAIAATYTAFMIGMLWLFPLFPAEAKLGPVYQPISHFIPLEFPILVIVPALFIDLAGDLTRDWPRWRQALAFGAVFLVTLIAAEWPFADFLQSEASMNWVFGTHYYPYMLQPETYTVHRIFMPDHELASGLARALAFAVGSSWIGLTVGDAMRRVKR